MPRKNGVDLVIEKEGGEPAEAIKTIAGHLGVSVPAVYKFRRQGWWPLERAQALAERYDLPLADLVKEDMRAALLAR
jgi:hypothetical protein